MRQKATVKELKGNTALLAVRRQSICEGCHRESGCSSCSQVLEIAVENRCLAEVGDIVEVETGSGAVIGTAALVFLLPLGMAFGAYFLAGLITRVGLYRYLAALLAMALTYVGIALVVRRLKKTLSVTMTAVLERAGTEKKSETKDEAGKGPAGAEAAKERRIKEAPEAASGSAEATSGEAAAKTVPEEASEPAEGID